MLIAPSLALHHLALFASAAVAVVAFDDSPATIVTAQVIAAKQLGAGAAVQTLAETAKILTGLDQPREIDAAALRRMLRQAEEEFSNFRTFEALTLRRKVLEAFEKATRPDDELRDLATETAIAIAAALLSEGDREAAETAARLVITHYHYELLDSVRYPPKVRTFFSEVKAGLDDTPQGEVRITCDRGGKVFADARFVGFCREQLKATLFQSEYRIWL